MSIKTPSQLKILNDTLDLMTLMTHARHGPYFIPAVLCVNKAKKEPPPSYYT